MNAIVPAKQNLELATRFVETLIRWFPKADPDPIWTKQAIDMLAPYPVDVFVALHANAQKEFRGFPSIPALRQCIDKTISAMALAADKSGLDTRKGFQSDWRTRANGCARDAMRALGVAFEGYLPIARHELFLWLSDRAWEAIRADSGHATPDHIALAQKVPANLLNEARAA